MKKDVRIEKIANGFLVHVNTYNKSGDYEPDLYSTSSPTYGEEKFFALNSVELGNILINVFNDS